MNEKNNFYLNLGSNIEPEKNLQKTINLLAKYGIVQAISNAWESNSIGAIGPNFLNACILFTATQNATELKDNVISFIEESLGRHRTNDKNAPRTIDIDILMVNDEPLYTDRWDNPFVVLPLAELLPEFTHPSKHQTLSEVAKQMSSQTWIIKREDILNSSINRMD